MADALERAGSLTSLNGCDQYAAIRTGGLRELKLEHEWELGVWASHFLGRSASTLTVLDIRLTRAKCAQGEMKGGRGVDGGSVIGRRLV